MKITIAEYVEQKRKSLTNFKQDWKKNRRQLGTLDRDESYPERMEPEDWDRAFGEFEGGA